MNAIDPLRTAPAADTRDARLRTLSHQMEGVFLGHLLQALRATVPAEGLLTGGSGEEMFTALFDEQMAQAAAARQEHGLGAALFRQLRAALATPGTATAEAP